jgi:hypothetical protein
MNGSFYGGEVNSLKDMCLFTETEAITAFRKDKARLIGQEGDVTLLDDNLEQCFVLSNVWAKFALGLGAKSFSDYVVKSIKDHGLITTIATCSDTADAIIANRGIPTALRFFVDHVNGELDKIKVLLQLLRFPKRFSPANASLIRDEDLNSFADEENKRHSLFYDKLVYGTGVTQRHIKYSTTEFLFNDDGSVSIYGSKLISELRDIVSEILSVTTTKYRKWGAGKRRYESLTPITDFTWSYGDLDKGAIFDSIPSGAAMNSCKNKVCKALNAQMVAERGFGDFRYVPPYIAYPRKAHLIHNHISAAKCVVSPIRSDVVIVKGVPKTYKHVRLVAPETVDRAIKAWMVERELRRIISMSKYKSCILIDIDDTPAKGQKYANVQHQRAAHGERWATMDFSNASDQQLKSLIKQLYPEAIFKKLMYCVPKFFSIQNKRNPKIFRLKMVSTMGNPITFRSMEIVLGAICIYSIRLYNDWCNTSIPDTDFSVYGDDVAINAQVAETFISVCESLGLVLNISKSHWEGQDPYREACGREYWNGVDITSVYWPRRCLKIDETTECRDTYDDSDKSYWSSVVALNNHLVDLVASKFGEDVALLDVVNFLHQYIATAFPDAIFTNPRAPWRKDGILLGYETTVPIIILDDMRHFHLVRKVYDFGSSITKTVDAHYAIDIEKEVDLGLVEEIDIPTGDTFALSERKRVSYLEACQLYDEPRVRFLATTVGEIGRTEGTKPSLPGSKGNAGVCACTQVTDIHMDLYAQSLLYNLYLTHGPEELGSSIYEKGLTTKRKLDRDVPIIGLKETII